MCSRLSGDNQSTMSDSRLKHPIKQTSKQTNKEELHKQASQRGEHTDPLVVLTRERASECVCLYVRKRTT